MPRCLQGLGVPVYVVAQRTVTSCASHRIASHRSGREICIQYAVVRNGEMPKGQQRDRQVLSKVQPVIDGCCDKPAGSMAAFFRIPLAIARSGIFSCNWARVFVNQGQVEMNGSADGDGQKVKFLRTGLVQGTEGNPLRFVDGVPSVGGYIGLAQTGGLRSRYIACAAWVLNFGFEQACGHHELMFLPLRHCRGMLRTTIIIFATTPLKEYSCWA